MKSRITLLPGIELPILQPGMRRAPSNAGGVGDIVPAGEPVARLAADPDQARRRLNA